MLTLNAPADVSSMHFGPARSCMSQRYFFGAGVGGGAGVGAGVGAAVVREQFASHWALGGQLAVG